MKYNFLITRILVLSHSRTILKRVMKTKDNLVGGVGKDIKEVELVEMVENRNECRRRISG